MTESETIGSLAKEIQRSLREMEGIFWEVAVASSYYDGNRRSDDQDDEETWLFHGTRVLYYKICLFFELKRLPFYLKMFKDKFAEHIDSVEFVTNSRAPLYENSEPSMVILDNFRDFLSPFHEFDFSIISKGDSNKLKLILENTIPILTKTGTNIISETSISEPVKWIIEIFYPNAKLNSSRFIKKFKTYKPDILVPEVSSAVEYKYIRKGKNIGDFLDQLKTDCDNYDGDQEYKYFYAVVYFEDKSQYNPEAFRKGVNEKGFKENWYIMAM